MMTKTILDTRTIDRALTASCDAPGSGKTMLAVAALRLLARNVAANDAGGGAPTVRWGEVRS